jgi:hypothetical protein
MKKQVIFIVICALLFCGCGLLDKDYEIKITNDTFLDDVAVYLDGDRRMVLAKPFSADPNHQYAEWFNVATDPTAIIWSKSIKGVDEGDHVLEVRCKTLVYKHPLYIDKDLKLKISELTGVDSILP